MYKKVIAVQPEFFAEFYQNLMSVMYNATRSTLGEREKYPTIYSARHQFASNLKANYKAQGIKASKYQRMVAVLMGQGSPKTSTYNYGLTSKGEELSATTVPDEIELKVATGAIGLGEKN